MFEPKVDKYLDSCPDEARAVLIYMMNEVSRRYDVSSKISYGMPCFYYRGRYLVGFGSFSKHMSIFPGALPPNLGDSLESYDTTKGSIHFTVDKPIDIKLLNKILDYRKNEIDKLT